MNGEKLLDALALAEEDLLEPVALLRERKRMGIPWMRYASLAACVCIIAGGILVWHRMYHGMSGTTTETMAGVVTEAVPEATWEEGAPETEAAVNDGETLAVPETESYGGEAEFVYTPQVSIRWLETIGDCLQKTDYVVICRVEEVGEAFAEKDPSVIGIPGGSGELEYVRSIRTPLTLSVTEILYDRNGTAGDTMQALEYYGTVGNYTLEGIFPVRYEEGHEYLLYLAQRPDGKANGILAQGSVELFREETEAEGETVYSHFCPLVNEKIYHGYPDAESIFEAIRTAGNEMTANQEE